MSQKYRFCSKNVAKTLIFTIIYYLWADLLNQFTMKKTLLIALAGMMLFAFTQCGGGTKKGSKEFQDNMELYNKIEKSVKDAKTCDELKEAVLGILVMGIAKDKSYADDEKMTESEKAELDKLGDKLQNVMEEKSKKLGCE